MFKQGAWWLANRTCNSPHCVTSSTSFLRNTISQTSRSISHTPRLCEKTAGDKYHDASTAAERGAAGQHEGSASRTNNQISFEYPDEQEVPRSKVVQGRGGFHMKRTLPSFSLEGKVAVVTGGARGLGLVMSQALIQSGADLAIVDLNSQSLPPSSIRATRNLLTVIQRRKASTKLTSW
jgi:D-arabinitol 2-dehydrogenase